MLKLRAQSRLKEGEVALTQYATKCTYIFSSKKKIKHKVSTRVLFDV